MFILVLFLIFERLLVLYLPFAKGLLVFTILIQIVGGTIIIASILGIRRDYKAVVDLINSFAPKNLDDSA